MSSHFSSTSYTTAVSQAVWPTSAFKVNTAFTSSINCRSIRDLPENELECLKHWSLQKKIYSSALPSQLLGCTFSIASIAGYYNKEFEEKVS